MMGQKKITHKFTVSISSFVFIYTTLAAVGEMHNCLLVSGVVATSSLTLPAIPAGTFALELAGRGGHSATIYPVEAL